MPKATPQHLDDPTYYKDYKPPVAGSGIRVDKNKLEGSVDFLDRSPADRNRPPVKKEDFMGSKPSKDMPEGAQTLPYKFNKKAESEIKMVPLATGGMASRRADGIAQRGKTRGTLIMCGGGYAKGKK
jgi:hypothetical protein